MRGELNIETAQSIATQTQAYEAQNIASQAQFQSVRSQGTTEGAFTVNTRANRLTTSGAVQNDRWLESDTRFEYRWTGTAWEFIGGFGKGNTAAFGAITASANDNGAEYYVTDTGSWWYVSGGAWVERSKLNVTTEYRVNGVKVVGAQGAAIASPTGGVTVDTEARAAIDAIRSFLQGWGATL
jgi:hypothetical protein